MTPKEYLSRYRDMGQSIDAKRAQLQRLREQAVQITQAIRPDRVQSSGDPDRLSGAVARIADAAAEIEQQILQREAVRWEIEAAIEKVPDGAQRVLLEYRYLAGYTFEHIAVDMHYSYKQVCRIHGYALEKVKDVLECPIAPVL